MEKSTQSQFLNEHEAASWLGVSVATLRKWRWSGTPALPFRKFGSLVRYCPAELEAFAEASKRNSTSAA